MNEVQWFKVRSKTD